LTTTKKKQKKKQVRFYPSIHLLHSVHIYFTCTGTGGHYRHILSLTVSACELWIASRRLS